MIWAGMLLLQIMMMIYEQRSAERECFRVQLSDGRSPRQNTMVPHIIITPKANPSIASLSGRRRRPALIYADLQGFHDKA